ncbi:MAG TPA: MFS transporter [Candidatus Dormibacteraeota bacterium]|nr:MFS transporter [Candidatus Dormibacteraeota bacterium]
MLLGTLLNPLNSSMIAVALVQLHRDFGISLDAASWLVSGFYLAAAVGQPVTGRLADLFGARRVFCAGLMLGGTTSVLASLTPSFGWLVAARVVQAIGTSAAFPAGLALIRRGEGRGRVPAGALAALSVASNVSAALGPALGGLLVGSGSWRAIFLVNVPITLAGLILAGRWLPADPPRPEPPAGVARSAARAALGRVDLPGVILFAGLLTALLAFLLSIPEWIAWPLLPTAALAAGLLWWRELRASEPFLDLRMLAAHPRLIGVYAQFAVVNLVFYSIFLGLAVWFEQVRGLDPGRTGLIMLPLTALAVLVSPLAAGLIRRTGPRSSLVLGSSTLTLGCLLLLLFGPSTPIAVLLGVGAVLGIPTGLNNLGLQAALYEAAPAEAMGTAGGQFQTFRYVGAILSTSLLGLVFGQTGAGSRLHLLALALAAVSLGLVAASIRSPGHRRREAAPRG